MSKEFLDAFADLRKEKNLSEEEVIGAIKDSIENAYKKNYGASNVRVEVDMEQGDVKVFMGLEVVEEVMDDMTEISLADAKEIYEGHIEAKPHAWNEESGKQTDSCAYCPYAGVCGIENRTKESMSNTRRYLSDEEVWEELS